MVYGTSYCGRENCYIGKLNLEINYQEIKEFITAVPEALSATAGATKPNGAADPSQMDISQTMFNQANQQCFMHRETFINRKIPLSANISV